MNTTTASKANKIRCLNDQLRKFFIGGRIMLTAAVSELEPAKKARLLQAVRDFKDFDADNNPHHEHDLGGFDFEGERYLFKIDYYAPDMEHGSEDPSDPKQTCRVLTIMHASDY